MSHLPCRLAVRIASLLPLALVAMTMAPMTAQAASGDATFVGHGWGHGRGMGQYGALGYAVNYGWSSAQILDHFYGGTVAGNAGNPEMTVELMALTGRDTIVTGTGLAINGVPVGAAALVRRTAAGTFQVYTGPGCGGSWTSKPGLLGSGLTISASGASSGVLGNLVRICEATGERAYRGSLTVVSDGATQRTINHVLTESYLRGVVPRESPASWGSLGGGKGMQALRAQAVAARSYALASTRPSGARTCDTTACQVYGGAGFKTGPTWVPPLENALTDSAISETAGVVRLKAGAIARTEFSSSTGGWTAGGTFPAVVDTGDGAQSPYHTWTTTLPLPAVAAKLGTGTIRTIVVTARSGLGENSGRATNVRVITTAGVVNDFSGNTVRAALGLRSDWFSISSMSLAEAQSIVKALYADLLLRPVDPSGLATWSLQLASGVSQTALVGSLTKSTEYVRLRVAQAYQEVLGRAPETVGLAGWTSAIMAGKLPVDDVQRVFYTTPEFYQRSGATSRGYVDLLYRAALKRSPSPSESASWTRQFAVSGRSAVVHGVWFSMEAAMSRAGKYYEVFLKRVADPAGQAGWARVLLGQGEGAVRIGIAGSKEYRLLASVRFH